MNRRAHFQGGFTLIEVLVGIVIFALGMMALAQLQGSLSRSSAEANARTVAINIAEETVERLRSFGQITASDTVDAFNNIVTYPGPDDEPLVVQRGGIDYTVTQVVSDYYYTPGNSPATAFQLDKPDSRIVNPDLKRLELTVTWGTNDAALGAGSITLVDLISSFTTASGAKVVLNSYGDSLYAPPVDYNPGENPDIISIELGDNKFKESTTPLPDVIRTNELVETRFDVVTYSQNDEGATFLRREEFRTVSCQCTLRIPNAGEESGRRPTIWNGSEYIEGEFVSKPFGESASNIQSQYCDMCCRDHHDGGVGTEDDGSELGRSLYSPLYNSVYYYESENGLLAGDHKHYRRDRDGSMILAEADGDFYLEACRMVRKDGFWRIAQDLSQKGLNAFPANYLDEETEVDEYSAYVTNAVTGYKSAMGSDGRAPPALTEPRNMSPAVVFPASAIDIPTEMASNGVTEQQLRSRGIYIDYMTDELREKISCLETYQDGARCQVPAVTTALEIIPFYDVQLTWLARWNETPNNNPVDVTNEAIADNNAHSRGVAELQLGFGPSTIDSAIHSRNLGLTGTDPIDPLYGAQVESYDIFALAVDYATPPALSGIIISGAITSSVPGVRASDVEIEATGAQCDRTPTGYECNLEVGANNPRIRFFNYFRMNTILEACSEVLRVHGTEHNSSGTSASDNWTRFWFPRATTANADIVIRQDTCGYN
jgi:prepilin-type N-terminal cleavage/methylation domain-containing protein